MRAKSFFYVCGGLFLLALGYHCGAGTARAESTKDVQGWRTTRWGMTEDQVAAALKGEGFAGFVAQHPGPAGYFIPCYPVGTDTMYVLLYMGAKGLDHVRVCMDNLKSKDAADRIEATLVERYGPPTNKSENTRDHARIRRVWVYPTTTIDFSLFEYPRDIEVRDRWLIVRYKPTKGGNDESR